jgi:hypothetical protein
MLDKPLISPSLLRGQIGVRFIPDLVERTCEYLSVVPVDKPLDQKITKVLA